MISHPCCRVKVKRELVSHRLIKVVSHRLIMVVSHRLIVVFHRGSTVKIQAGSSTVGVWYSWGVVQVGSGTGGSLVHLVSGTGKVFN